jgi:hypothetical protein
MDPHAANTATQEPVLDRTPITQVGNLAQELLEQVQRPVVVWRPDQGDAQAIAGVVVCTQTALSNFGPYPIVDLDDGQNIWRINVLGQVFAREVEFRQVGEGRWTTKLSPGDQLAVYDSGERIASKVAGRTPYRSVRVIHRPLQSAPVATEAPSIAPIDDEIPF